MLLMVNMLGYFLGHYPQHFELSEEQRNLILQTMMFFIWLAGGGGVFARVSGWTFVDALYFCDVTILTVGFGDLHPVNDLGRGLVFPYSVGGIVILGLMVSSIRQFAKELSRDNVVRSHVERRRVRTMERSVTSSFELAERQKSLNKAIIRGSRPIISEPFGPKARSVTFEPKEVERSGSQRRLTSESRSNTFSSRLRRVGSSNPKLVLMREEKDRFDAMRDIQRSTISFKRYYALAMSVIAFGLLWCVGAVGFWQAEQKTQGLTYFEALYFCYVSLLTIGYGDLSPTSNAGKPFFIVWSLLAVPTMTILISDMGDTVIASFKRGTFTIADWTVLPKAGLRRAFLEKHPWFLEWLQNRATKAAATRRVAEGFPTGPVDEGVANYTPPTLEDVAGLNKLDEHAIARKLALAIREVANDLRASPPRKYTYEEWAEFTHLIRFSRMQKSELEEEEEELGLIEWDWIGEDSPMLAHGSESEWVLDRLCESLDRYMKKQIPQHMKKRRKNSSMSEAKPKSN
jgi:potassium channel subfamily K